MNYRVIKFRAWDVEMRQMLTWEELQKDWEREGYYDSVFRNDHWRCMQFTGLHDKNGKEIYEGHELNNKFVVSFKDGAYVMYNISAGDIEARLSEEVINEYVLEITREYAKLEKD